MSNHTPFKAFFTLSLLCVSVQVSALWPQVSALWPFDFVIKWLRAREESSIAIKIRARQRDFLAKQIGDENLKKIAQHAAIDETTPQNIAQRFLNRVLCKPWQKSSNTPEKIAHFKSTQPKFKNKNYVKSQKNEKYEKAHRKNIQMVIDKYYDQPGDAVLKSIFVDNKQSQPIIVATQNGPRLGSTHSTTFSGGRRVLKGDLIINNEYLLKNAYLDVDNSKHETAREILESLEALQKMQAQKAMLDAHYKKYSRSKKTYASVKASYEDIIDASLKKLKED